MAKTDLATIEKQLAEEAGTVRGMIGAPEGRKIYIHDETGNFTAPGGLNLGNELRVIVVDFCTAHRYYPEAFNRNAIKPPVCFAFGDVIAEMAPEEEAPEKQADLCKDCWANEWKSAGIAGSNAKACKNTRELAIVLADDLEDEELEAEMFSLTVSPSSIASFDSMINVALRLFNGPPIKAIVTIRAVKVANYWTIQFSAPEPNPYLARVFDLRGAESEALIARIPDLSNYTPTVEKPARGAKAPTNVPRGRPGR